MNEEKMDGECTSKTFWKEVALIGWGVEDENSGAYDIYAKKKVLLSRWTPEFARAFQDRGSELQLWMHNHLESWEEGTGNHIECSDDGMGDLTAHIIGMGQAFYEKVTNLPEIAYKMAKERSYEENFFYCIPHPGRELTVDDVREYDDEGNVCSTPEEEQQDILRARLGDWASIRIEHYQAWAKRELEQFEWLLDNPLLPEELKPDVSFCISSLLPLVEDGDFESLLKVRGDFVAASKKVANKLHEIGRKKKLEADEFLDMHNYYSSENLCGDLERYMK